MIKKIANHIDRPLSYKTLLEFIRHQWEVNGKEPTLHIHRDQFIGQFADVGFEFINRFLRDLDERYHAIRVTEYAYSKKWEHEKYMDLTASEVAAVQGTEPYGKNLDAINQTILTTSIVMEPGFLDVLKSFTKPFEESSISDSPVESQAVAKIDGNKVLIGFADAELVLLNSVRLEGGSYNFMHYLQGHTDRTISLAEIQTLDGCKSYKNLGEQVRYLGFVKKTKHIFFEPITKTRVRFTPKVILTEEQKNQFQEQLKAIRK